MSWDIFGNPLQRGHCEVHPHVHEEYPCSVCISEKRQHAQPSCDGRCENALYLAQADDHIKSLQARVAELESICESVPEGCTGKALAKLKADAVRDAILALSAECDFKSGAIASVTGSGYWKTFSDWLEQKANQIEREGGV